MVAGPRRAGRDVLYQTAAKASFVVGGYAVHLGLGRYLGPVAYGTIGIVLSVTGIMRIFVMNGVRQAVSRLTAVSDVPTAGLIRHKALQAQAILVTAVTSIYLALVSPIGRWLGDETLVPYLRLAALFIPLAGFYVVYLSSLNGLREFGKQASVIISYSVVRVLGSLGLVLLGFHLYGAVIGLLLAPLVALTTGWLFARHLGARQNGKPLTGSQTADLIRFAVPMLLYAVGTSILLNLDLFLVKRLLLNETAAGLYSAGMALSQGLYYMAQVFVEILFPTVGAISSRLGRDETAAYVRRWLRLVIMAILAGAMLLSSGAREVIGWTYASGYSDVAGPLGWLSWGMGFYALFVILTNIIAALGSPWAATGLALGLVPVSALLNAYLIPRLDLTGAAMATTATLLLGTFGGWLWLSTLLHRPLDGLTLLRVGVAALLGSGAASLSGPDSHVLGRWSLSVLVYFSVLILSKELTQHDWTMIKALLRPHKPRRI
jgi:O-antigen/teichoic acid export membrane protein